MVEHEKVIGPTESEIDKTDRRVEENSDVNDKAQRLKFKIAGALAGAMVAVAGCSPEEIDAVPTTAVIATEQPSTEKPTSSFELSPTPELTKAAQPTVQKATSTPAPIEQNPDSPEGDEQEVEYFAGGGNKIETGPGDRLLPKIEGRAEELIAIGLEKDHFTRENIGWKIFTENPGTSEVDYAVALELTEDYNGNAAGTIFVGGQDSGELLPLEDVPENTYPSYDFINSSWILRDGITNEPVWLVTQGGEYVPFSDQASREESFGRRESDRLTIREEVRHLKEMEKEQVTLESTSTATPQPTATPVPTRVSEEVTQESESVETSGIERVLAVPLDAQDLSLSCESAASAMVAAYFDISLPEGYVSLEDYFIQTIPKHCNPHRGYRGLISGALSTSCNAEAGLGYGTYAEPVATALQRLGVPATVHYGVDYQWVAEQITAGRPVVAWMSGKNVQPEYEVDPETDQKYVLYLGEHLWVISGVEEVNGRYKFRVNDPWKGRQYWVWGFPNWEVFNNMSIVTGPK